MAFWEPRRDSWVHKAVRFRRAGELRSGTVFVHTSVLASVCVLRFGCVCVCLRVCACGSCSLIYVLVRATRKIGTHLLATCTGCIGGAGGFL